MSTFSFSNTDFVDIEYASNVEFVPEEIKNSKFDSYFGLFFDSIQIKDEYEFNYINGFVIISIQEKVGDEERE